MLMDKMSWAAVCVSLKANTTVDVELCNLWKTFVSRQLAPTKIKPTAKDCQLIKLRKPIHRRRETGVTHQQGAACTQASSHHSP